MITTTSFHFPSRLFFNITVRNSPDEVRKCLLGLASQESSAWHGCITDDASEDGTRQVIQEIVGSESLPLHVRCSRERKWKAENFIAALDLAGPCDTIVELDGDDMITSPDFVEEMVRLHKKYDTVWTQYENESSRYPDFVELFSRSTALHSQQWNRASSGGSLWGGAQGSPGAVRTFKAAYFDTIPLEYLKLEGSESLTLGFDGAYYTAVLERTHPSLRYFYDRVFLRRYITGKNEFFSEKSGDNLTDRKQNYDLIHRYLLSLEPLSELQPTHEIAIVTPPESETWASILANRAAGKHFEVFVYPDSFYMDLVSRPGFALHVEIYNLQRLLESDYPFHAENVQVESMDAFENLRGKLGSACTDLIRKLKPAQDVRMHGLRK